MVVEDGKVSKGMIPKLASCVHALRHGVTRAHILDGRVPHALLLEFFTRACTVGHVCRYGIYDSSIGGFGCNCMAASDVPDAGTWECFL